MAATVKVTWWNHVITSFSWEYPVLGELSKLNTPLIVWCIIYMYVYAQKDNWTRNNYLQLQCCSHTFFTYMHTYIQIKKNEFEVPLSQPSSSTVSCAVQLAAVTLIQHNMYIYTVLTFSESHPGLFPRKYSRFSEKWCIGDELCARSHGALFLKIQIHRTYQSILLEWIHWGHLAELFPKVTMLFFQT